MKIYCLRTWFEVLEDGEFYGPYAYSSDIEAHDLDEAQEIAEEKIKEIEGQNCMNFKHDLLSEVEL